MYNGGEINTSAVLFLVKAGDQERKLEVRWKARVEACWGTLKNHSAFEETRRGQKQASSPTSQLGGTLSWFGRIFVSFLVRGVLPIRP